MQVTKVGSEQLTSRSHLGQMNGLPCLHSPPSLGLSGHLCSFQESFVSKLCLQAIITSQCPLHPWEEEVLPLLLCQSQLPPFSLLCRPAQTALSLPSHHLLSCIRIIQVHALFLLLVGKQGGNTFSSSLSSPQHLHFVTWVPSRLSHAQLQSKKEKDMHFRREPGTIFPTTFCTTKFNFLKYCLNLFSKNIFL